MSAIIRYLSSVHLTSIPILTAVNSETGEQQGRLLGHCVVWGKERVIYRTLQRAAVESLHSSQLLLVHLTSCFLETASSAAVRKTATCPGTSLQAPALTHRPGQLSLD